MKAKYFFAAILMTVSGSMMAQDEVETSLGADVVSQYIWRGQNLGNAAIQPTLGISYKGISLSAWGSAGITSAADTKEFDLTLGYTTGSFNVGITDYWFNTNPKYFRYSNGATSHVFEANVGYDFGFLNLQWFTNFAGDDGLNKSGNRAYSSYLELSAPFKLGGLDWTATLGAVPYATSFYSDADGFAVTNISVGASYTLIDKPGYELPVFATISANPSSERAFFAIGFSLKKK